MEQFICEDCGAEYGVIVLTAPGSPHSKASCIHCQKVLPATRGEFVLQYTLLKRPDQPEREAC